ncbi:FHA domain-containing protein [Botrimarina hoheduenensis]|uniref:FHA domain-containing protein n=1 Tax=Botrimarina hoheduenensis TaxID=2528000 RepID=A0A5C5W8I0_9BACT|nr:FHA domain-containing protein [Botrimarina hoheduenensis]TWT46767.1 hypothetical protein Pla111_18680 [Botrimarina hoheduenensis]
MFCPTDRHALAVAPRQQAEKVGRLSSRLRETVLLDNSLETPRVATIPLQYDSRGERYLVWIDRVGGYLLCLADEIVIGQANGSLADADGPDLGLQADLSRRHATLTRREGQYVLSPRGAATVDGRPVQDATVLNHGAEIGLGDAVRLRFERPHALSASARLTVASGHRTVPSADGVLLMAESCVLGPQPHSHVRCPQWHQDLLLYKGTGGLLCRSSRPVSVSGPGPAVLTEGPVAIPPGARIEAESLCFSIERA